MDIRALRSPPLLPPEYFQLQQAMDQVVADLPLLRRPHNVATGQALMALEAMNHSLRPIAMREIQLKRLIGQGTEVTDYSSALSGVIHALRILLRVVDNLNVPDGSDVAIREDLQDEARSALRSVSGWVGAFAVINDTALGWRTFEVDGSVVRAMAVSPERFARGLSLDVQEEAEKNARYLEINEQRPGYLMLQLAIEHVAERVPPAYVFEPDDQLLELDAGSSELASEMLGGWTIPLDISVMGSFTAGEYRAVSEAMQSYAGLVQRFEDARTPRGGPRLVVKARDEWAAFLARRTGTSEAAAVAIVEYMTHRRTDIWERGNASPAAPHTPLFELTPGQLTLCPTLAIWRDPQSALRAIWKTRATGNYNARMSELNHELSRKAANLFGARGWPSVYRRKVPGGGDIDAGTGTGDVFISGECKAFYDDPVREGDDPAVWRELERNVSALRNPETARRVLNNERLTPTRIKGLVILPGRAQSPVDFGDDYALVGLEDLSDATRASSSPQELWQQIKVREAHAPVATITVRNVIGDWTLESDGVSRSALVDAHTGAPPRPGTRA